MGKEGSPNRVLQAQWCGAKKNVLHIPTSLCISLPEAMWEGPERSGDSRPLLAAAAIPSIHCIMSGYGILMENLDNSSPPFKITSSARTTVPMLFCSFCYLFFQRRGQIKLSKMYQVVAMIQPPLVWLWLEASHSPYRAAFLSFPPGLTSKTTKSYNTQNKSGNTVEGKRPCLISVTSFPPKNTILLFSGYNRSRLESHDLNHDEISPQAELHVT